MSDKEDREPKPLLKLNDLIHDLLLHDDVERGCRFVHDHQWRVKRERGRNHRALPHAAGELMRERPDAAGIDPNDRQQLGRTFHCLFAMDSLVGQDRVRNLVTDRQNGIEGIHRALEDHRDVSPAELL